MPMPGPYRTARRPNGLLVRFSDTFGEMGLRKANERAIRAARAKAELNSKCKSAFLSTISRELRAPLNDIIAFSDQLRIPGGTTPDKTAQYAEHIADAGRRLLDIVSDVIDMSGLEAGGLELDKRRVNLAEILDLALARTRKLFEAKGQIVTMKLDAPLPAIEGDAKRLVRIFANLLSNASKFTPDKGRILVLARALPDGAVSIAVADTGLGMTQEQMVAALSPFAPLQRQSNRDQEGAGLGLPLAMALVRLHGGTLHLDSEAGQGTTAMVTLPACVSQPSGKAT